MRLTIHPHWVRDSIHALLRLLRDSVFKIHIMLVSTLVVFGG